MFGPLIRERPSVGLAADRNRLRRRVRTLLGEAGYALLGPTEADAQRQDVFRRALMALAVLTVVPIQHSRLPGWPAVAVACGVVLAYDIGVAYLVFAKQRFLLARVLGTLFDVIILMGASFYVLREMGAAGVSSDIWLVFIIYVVIGGLVFAPLGALVYTALWIAWFAAATLLFFPADSDFRAQLPLRLVFFGAIGLSALVTAGELDRRRAKLAQQNRQTMGMLAKLVEARDTDAGAHLHGIQHFSRALALHIGLSEREADEIAYASMVHDVGKANVPDAILKKAGPLSDEEWRTMQEHTICGDQLLTENSDFEFARQVARWHHEHCDGNGYPDGLSGEEIPLAARIVAVADVYDALISKRPYKEAWPAETAITELRRLAGSHLDPALVAAFCELWEAGTIRRISEQIGKQSVEENLEAA
jgi:hypothetical protein